MSALLWRELIQGCTSKSAVNKLKKVIVLWHSAYVSLHLRYCVQFWGPQYRKDMDILDKGGYLANQARVRVIEGQRRQGLFSLEKTKVKGDLMAQQQKKKWTEAGRREILIICKEFFNSQRGFSSRLSKEIVEYLSLEIFRTRLYMVQSNLI